MSVGKLEDFEELNSFIANEYEPEQLAIEPPKPQIFESIKKDNEERDKKLIEVKGAKKFESSVNRSAKDRDNDRSYTVNSYKSSSYGSSSGYRSYSYYSSKDYNSEDVIKKEFKDIREQAFKMAEEELNNKTYKKRYNNNPQLDVLMKKNKGIKTKVKGIFREGSIGRKGLLVGGILVTKGLAIMLQEIKHDIYKN